MGSCFTEFPIITRAEVGDGFRYFQMMKCIDCDNYAVMTSPQRGYCPVCNPRTNVEKRKSYYWDLIVDEGFKKADALKECRRMYPPKNDDQEGTQA